MPDTHERRSTLDFWQGVAIGATVTLVAFWFLVFFVILPARIIR